MNLFSLHGKWYESNEDRLTANLLFFLSEFRGSLLKAFLTRVLPRRRFTKAALRDATIRSHPYEDGRIPDAELILEQGGRAVRILVEAKIGTNRPWVDQLREYSRRLNSTAGLYPDFRLVVITQVDEKQHVRRIEESLRQEGVFDEPCIVYFQWRELLQMMKNTIGLDGGSDTDEQRAYGPRLLHLFLEEVEATLYNHMDISNMRLGDLNEVVLMTENDDRGPFLDMALHHNVFWPKANFHPSQYVAYYVTAGYGELSKKITHVARVKHLWHSISIRDVLELEEFRHIPDPKGFRAKALTVFPIGSEALFAIGITGDPVRLPNPIPYVHRPGVRLNPKILPGRQTSWEALLTANELEDLLGN